jgi:penicillin-binding protein 1C
MQLQNDECRMRNKDRPHARWFVWRCGSSILRSLSAARGCLFGQTKRQILRRVGICGLLIAVAIAGFQLAVLFWPYPAADARPAPASAVVTDRNGVPLAMFVSSHGEWSLPLREDQISPHLLKAIVAVEDQRFYEHGGVDWFSAAGAAWHDVRSLSLHRGASTITMQLEHLREPEPRSIFAKIAQAIKACQIERTLTKRQILVEYLNRAPFGSNLVGAGAASWRYFGRKCADLSLGQAALLAGLPQSPSRFRPDRHPDAALGRREHVLDRMLACGMITTQQRAEARQEIEGADWCRLPQETEDLALLPTTSRLAREMPGREIHLTIDRDTQAQAAELAGEQLETLTWSHVNAAAVVVLDTQNGRCLAAVSRSPLLTADHVDLTIQARSSGSVLKPLIYAAAFDAGIFTPRTVLDDSPTSWAGYEPADYDRQFDGPMPAGEALALSRNIPALWVLSKVGVARAVELMRGSGLATVARTPDRYGLSLAIGGAEVTPMELAEAYAMLGRGGRDVPVSLVTDDAGESVAEGNVRWFSGGQSISTGKIGKATHTGAILRSSSCLQVLRCLGDLDRTRRVCPTAVNLAPAWKTGTSSGHRDAWCAAVTPRRVVVAWMGNIDASGSGALVGQDAAAPLALRILAAVDHPTGVTAGFAPPPGFLTGRSTDAERPTQAILSMISPADHQQILRDGSLSADHQRVPLRAREIGADAGRLWWFVDGQCLGSCQSSERLWWDPVAGSHEVRVVDAAGRSAVGSVVVRGNAE